MATIDTQALTLLDGETLLTTLQSQAVEKRISDIHISPDKDTIRVEWREFGVLVRLLNINRDIYDAMIRRIKFSAKLKMNVSTVPQDGQYTFPFEDRSINVRTATLPTKFGEAITLRLLDPKRGIVPLADLGFPSVVEADLLALTDKPNGLILVTGPTGSGKTTTLYSLLSLLTGKEQNIITIENPVEYELPGIVQSQVDESKGFTFAEGLKSILRSDPDIVLVGEIRDLETAQTAIDASLTGHLVFATLHTNSAVEAIPRLLSMGVSSYTFAPSLRGVLAQRLVRTINPAYRSAPNEYKEKPDFYTGQNALPELLIVTPEIETMILNQSSSHEILETVRSHGFKTMQEWGADLVQRNVTTAEEVKRVTG
ncbi:MAG: GspE/PulE family protein [Candidatus Peribacteraceae bacterium]